VTFQLYLLRLAHNIKILAINLNMHFLKNTPEFSLFFD